MKGAAMGRYLNEFTIGEVFRTRGRTITEADVVQIAQFSGDWNPVHVDETVAGPAWGGRIAHGPMFPGIAIGMLAPFDLTAGTTVGLRKMEWEFVGPVLIGDTIQVEVEITSVSPHPERRDRGRVGMAFTVFNQREEVVNRCRTVAVILTGEE